MNEEILKIKDAYDQVYSQVLDPEVSPEKQKEMLRYITHSNLNGAISILLGVKARGSKINKIYTIRDYFINAARVADLSKTMY